MPINESIKENYLVHKNPMPLGVGVSVDKYPAKKKYNLNIIIFLTMLIHYDKMIK